MTILQTCFRQEKIEFKNRVAARSAQTATFEILGEPALSCNGEAYLLYDSDCGPCTRFMKLSKLLDFENALIPVSLHSEFASNLVRQKMSEEQVKKSFHIVLQQSDGKQVFSAGDGLIELLRFLPFGKAINRVFWRIKSLRDFAHLFYFLATRFRECQQVHGQSIPNNHP